MTEKEEEKLFSPDEINSMFDTGFLPVLEVISTRAKDKYSGELPIKFFQVALSIQLPPDAKDLTYESLKDRIRMQLWPVTQEDIDAAIKKQEEACANESSSDGS